MSRLVLYWLLATLVSAAAAVVLDGVLSRRRRRRDRLRRTPARMIALTRGGRR